eukprot:TRINITY_DN29440_c0_g1_i1.p1 TRINITY_DN29440_c0_g1~~TRINITY_DN29440_c0_g1_i1.p1  ORF type:complete len:583 (+),score=107.94 TRINITY_DN29440_c0_g1_i1:27-1751(+)
MLFMPRVQSFDEPLPIKIKAVMLTVGLVMLSSGTSGYINPYLGHFETKLYGILQCLLVLAAWAALGNFWFSEVWEDAKDEPGVSTALVLYIASWLPCVVRLAWFVVLVSSLLPRFIASPVSSSSRGLDGGELPACYTGKWYPSLQDISRASVCKVRGLSSLTSEGGRQYFHAGGMRYNASVFEDFFYFLETKRHTFQDAETRCLALRAHLADITSPAENGIVRNVCGERECWIWVRSPLLSVASQEKSLGLGVASPAFTNWAESVELAARNVRGAVSLNSVKECLNAVCAFGYAAHESFKVKVAFGTAGVEFFNAVTPFGLLSRTKVLLEKLDSKSLGRIQWFENVTSVFVTCQMMLLAFGFSMVLTGYYNRVGPKDGYRPGGPVLCLAHPKHLGSESTAACEGAFATMLLSFLAGAALLLGVQLVLCKTGVRCTLRHRAPQSAGRRQEQEPAYSFLTQVVGVPVADEDVPGELEVATGVAPSALSSAVVLARVRRQLQQSPEEIFRELDRRETGTLAPFQFFRFLQRYVPEIMPSDVQAIWNMADTDGDGHINCQDFCRLLQYVDDNGHHHAS